ncbi:WD40-repeat-containing domain protein [Syncephalastrum racemosum]|uniref:WD40-repeat-containing domain protein n=1 Tax=Syncephalastrum racemosum TaxID=13706 RepID=A0A1X2H7A7_SYNRA|nr:WD40-repeat-containing domain protein [Syncephalastrum racemosum]
MLLGRKRQRLDSVTNQTLETHDTHLKLIPAPSQPTQYTLDEECTPSIHVSPELHKRFKQRTHTRLWSAHHAVKQRSLYGNLKYHQRIIPPVNDLLPKFVSTVDQIYRFRYDDNDRRSAPIACDYAKNTRNGVFLAVGDEDRKLTILRTDKDNSVANGHYHRSWVSHTNAVVAVKWSPDDTMIATGSADQFATIWDAETQACLTHFQGHTSSLRSVHWHPTNKHLLVTASKDGTFRIWDTRYKRTEESTETIEPAPTYHAIRTTTAHNSSKRSGKKVIARSVDPSVTCAMFVPGSEEKIVSCGSVDGTIKLWDCRTGRDPKAIMESHHSSRGHARGIADLKLDSTGSRLFALSLDRSIYMYQLSHLRSQPLHRFQDPTYHNAYFCKLTVSPDDMFVAAASDNGSIYTWDVLRPHLPATRLQGHKAFVTGIAWSPSAEQQVASCSDDGTVRVWKPRRKDAEAEEITLEQQLQ